MPQQSDTNRWLPLVGGTILNLVLGVFYSWSVYVIPLETEFEWTRQQLSYPFSIGLFTMAVMFVVAGRLHAILGFRTIAAIGGILFGLGYFLASFTTSLWWLCLSYGVLAGAGNGFGYSVAIPVISRWFPDKRGLALGIAVGGYGAGSGIFGPIASEILLPSYGWETTFRIYGIVFFAVAMVGAWLLKPAPDGYVPSGWDPSQLKAAVTRTARDFTTSEMLRDRSFYLLFIAYCLGSMAGLGLIGIVTQWGVQEAGIASAGFIGLSIGAIGNTFGRVISGSLSDKLGRLNVLRLMVSVSAVAMPLLYLQGSSVLVFIVGVFIVYYCYGTLLSVFAATSADFYGTKYLGVNYGLLFLAWGIAGLLGGRLAGFVVDTYGSYELAFFGAATLSLLSLGTLLLTKAPQSPETASV